jgi:hypothetical protein
MSENETVLTVVSVDSLERNRLSWDESKKNPHSDSSVIPYYTTRLPVVRHFIGYAGRPATIKMPEAMAA